MTTKAHSDPGLPAHRYAGHVETCLSKPITYPEVIKRGLLVPLQYRPPQPAPRWPWLTLGLCALGLLVAVAWVAWCFYAEGALTLFK